METADIDSQQQKPRRMGLPPFFIRLMIFVLSPIAAIAMAMKNFASHFIAGTNEPP